MDKKYVLIIAIVNTGCTDLVMEAAKREGARGGTILNARGTGNIEMEKFYGIAIQPSKEMVLIVVDSSIKDKCLHAIYKEAGLETKGQGIAFTVPLEDVIGIE